MKYISRMTVGSFLLAWLTVIVIVPEASSKPFFFSEKSFAYTAKSREGSFKILGRFSARPELRDGPAHMVRVGLLEAGPLTVALPSHWDADELLYVIQGKGTIGMVPRGREGERMMLIGAGDVMWVPAGTMVYLVNADARESLRVAVLLKTISSTEGDYQEFFAAGGESESFLGAFSEETLAAAFISRKGELERILGGQKKGAFVKATEEQIKSLTHRAEESRRAFHLLSQKPLFSNDHGKMYEVSVDDYPLLRQLDADVSLANISSGGMVAPSYNTRATKIALVVAGEGYVEMTWPRHVSAGYEKLMSEVSVGDVFVIPSGQPVATVASGGEGLQILCFGLDVKDNRRIFLTGENGVLKRMEAAAKEMSFGVPAEEVDRVLDAQKQSVFVEGPHWK